jgi:hypothetical protein
MVDSEIIVRAQEYEAQGVGKFDALHAACAAWGQANLFITTDDRLVKKMRKIDTFPIMLPGEDLAFLGELV